MNINTKKILSAVIKTNSVLGNSFSTSSVLSKRNFDKFPMYEFRLRESEKKILSTREGRQKYWDVMEVIGKIIFWIYFRYEYSIFTHSENNFRNKRNEENKKLLASHKLNFLEGLHLFN